MASSPWETHVQNVVFDAKSDELVEWRSGVLRVNEGSGTRPGLPMQDFGVVLLLELHCDSAAARGIAKGRGLGKQRHIDLQSLRIQEKMAQGAFRLNPVSGKENTSDLLFKHLSSHCIQSCLDFMNCVFRTERSEVVPALREGRRKEGRRPWCRDLP